MPFILIILHLLHAASGELFVNTKIGNDNSLGTQSDPYLTIQHACNIADVSSSTTIYLLKTDKNNIHSSYTNGDLCVQNVLTGGSFEEDGTHHWNLLNSEIQTDIIHVGTKALRLRLPVVAPFSSSSSLSGARNQTVARHRAVTVKATHRHRVRYWARVIGANGNIASTNSICAQVAIYFYDSVGSKSTLSNNTTIPCRIDYTWQYKEDWIPSHGVDGNITVEITLLDTSGDYTIYVDDVSVVPFPGNSMDSFWSTINVDGRCDSRLPLSGIVGHVNGARVTDQYCEMYLNSGGWELFAMDGNGNSKANNLADLQDDSKDGLGTLISGTTILPPATLFKKNKDYFSNGPGTKLREILIVIRNPETELKRWIRIKPSVGGYVPPATLFNDIPIAPGGGTWNIENDRDQIEASWNDCRSRSAGDVVFLPTNLLRCRLFWKHMSSYTPAGNWKCGGNIRLFDNYQVDGNHNDVGALTLDGCYERCLAHPTCKYFNIIASKATVGGFCSGCSDNDLGTDGESNPIYAGKQYFVFAAFLVFFATTPMYSCIESDSLTLLIPSFIVYILQLTKFTHHLIHHLLVCLVVKILLVMVLS